MRTVLFEPDHGGHRFHYVRLIADGLIALGHEVDIAVSRGARDTDEFAEHLKPVLASTGIYQYPPIRPGTAWETAASRWRRLSLTAKDLRPDHLYVPFGDGMTQRGALEGLIPFRRPATSQYTEALHSRGHFAYHAGDSRSRVRGRISEVLVGRAPWDFLHLLDPLAYEYLVSDRSAGRLKVRFDLIPEPVESRNEIGQKSARSRLGLDEDARVVGCVGLIDTRKGVDRVLKAFEIGFGAGVRLLLVGRHHPSIRAALQTTHASAVRAGTIVSIDGYVSQEVLGDAFAACDVLALPYRSHPGSSGVLVRAAAARTPVVVSPYGWMGECVRRFELGRVCDPTNPSQLAASVRASLHQSPLVLTDLASRFVEFNSPESFKAVWTREIERRSGRSTQQLHTWEWVMTGETGG